MTAQDDEHGLQRSFGKVTKEEDNAGLNYQQQKTTGKGEILISGVITLYLKMFSFQQRKYKAYRETVKYGPFP